MTRQLEPKKSVIKMESLTGTIHSVGRLRCYSSTTISSYYLAMCDAIMGVEEPLVCFIKKQVFFIHAKGTKTVSKHYLKLLCKTFPAVVKAVG